MGAVAQISYKVVLHSGSRVGYGFGSPLASIMANFGAGSMLLCVIPTAVIVGFNSEALDGIGFFVLSIIGGILSPILINLIGIRGAYFVALLGLPINIILMFVSMSFL